MMWFRPSPDRPHRVRFEYLNAWLHGTRLRSALAACGYGIFTLWFAGVLLRG